MSFFNPQDIAFSETNTAKTPIAPIPKGVREGMSTTAAEGVKKDSDSFASKNS